MTRFFFTPSMEKHIEILLKKISYLAITIATLSLVLIYLLQPPPETCINPKSNPNHPKSSCDVSPRHMTTIDHKNHRLWSTNTFQKSVNSFTTLSTHLQTLNLITNHTRALIVSAGGGQGVMSLKRIGLVDVTGVEVVDSPPLVSRADPHNLPFFDMVFDFGFSAGLDQALFPCRYVGEMERCVKDGGVIVVCVDECGNDGVVEVVKLFRKSKFLEATNVTLMGLKMTMIITRRI